MIEKIEVFQTSDSKVFFTKFDAEQHESSLGIIYSVNAFLNSEQSPYQSDIAHSISRKAILSWEAWKKGQK